MDKRKIRNAAREITPPVLARFGKAFVESLGPSKAGPTLRKQAIDGTAFQISRKLLDSFQHLIFHPAVSGNSDMHYQDDEIRGAVACTAAEATLLYHAAQMASPTAPLEIGSYIGWSTAHIASGIHSKLTCVDPFLEVDDGSLHLRKDARAEARFRENITTAGLLDRIEMVAECSPGILPSIAPTEGWDWVFIDGWHVDGQPLLDLRGVLKHVRSNTILLLHDLWLADVRDAAVYLIADGWNCHVFNTSNYLTIFWRDQPPWMERLIAIGNGPEFENISAKSRRIFYGLTKASFDSAKAAMATRK